MDDRSEGFTMPEWGDEGPLRSKQHFSFEDVPLKEQIAHGGSSPILAMRMLTGADLGANHVDMVIVPPGADIGVHTHALSNQELYIVVSGEGVMTVDGREARVGPGHVVVNRPGGTHGLRNPGAEEIRLVVVEVPEPGNPPSLEPS
jgi:mannose-6-phosphate isomerase-like protein (cupin superfamily)